MKRSNTNRSTILVGVVCLVALLSVASQVRAAGAVSVARAVAAEAWPPPVAPQLFWSLLLDQFEYRRNEGADTFKWDVEGWVGRDYNRLWIRTEGEQRVTGATGGEAEMQLLYSRLIAPFWDLQVGVRHQRLYGSGPDRSRTFAAFGSEGLAPYRFDVEPALFISEDGDVSARFAATFDLLFTQRLIGQPRFEINAAAQEVEAFGVGEGVNNVELGWRLRYELWREFAPYIGVSWVRKLGDTATIARREGEQVDNIAFVIGVRMWF